MSVPSVLLLSDSPTQASHVQVAIQILDVNDNPPQLEQSYEPFVCDNTAPGHVSACWDQALVPQV